MSLNVLTPPILSEEKSIGGFCIVDPVKIDNQEYFLVDSALIGVPVNEFGWQELARRPEYEKTRTWTVMFDIDGNQIWQMGGENPTKTPNPHMTDAYIYNRASGIWSDAIPIDNQTGIAIQDLERKGMIGAYNTGDQKVYIGKGWAKYGGVDYYQRNMFQVDPDTNTWTLIGNLQGPKTRYSAGSGYSGFIFITGGHTRNNQTTDHFEVFKMAGAMSSVVYAPMPDRRSHHDTTIYHDGVDAWLYVAGGSTDVGHSPDTNHDPHIGVPTNFWRFNITQGYWEFNGILEYIQVDKSGHDHTILTDPVTGEKLTAHLTGIENALVNHATFDYQFTNIAQLPEPRIGAKIEYYDGGIWLFGGYDETPTTIIPDILRYDIATNTWENKGKMLDNWAQGSTAVIGDSMYWMGMWDTEDTSRPEQFWKYTFGNEFVCAIKTAER